MDSKRSDKAALLQRSLEMSSAGSIGVMAALALCSSIIVISLGRPLVDWKLGKKRKNKVLFESFGVKAILPQVRNEEDEAAGTAVDSTGVVDAPERGVIKSEANSSENKVAPPKIKGGARSRSRAENGRKENVDARNKLKDDAVSFSDWNANAGGAKEKRSNSSCLLFVGSFRTSKGDREADAGVCPYCSFPLSSALSITSSSNNNGGRGGKKVSSSSSSSSSSPSQLQSRIKGLGLRTMTKRIGPDPKEVKQRFVL